MAFGAVLALAAILAILTPAIRRTRMFARYPHVTGTANVLSSHVIAAHVTCCAITVAVFRRTSCSVQANAFLRAVLPVRIFWTQFVAIYTAITGGANAGAV